MTERTRAARGALPDFAPGDIGTNAAIAYFERGEGIRIARNRWFVASLLLSVVLVLEAAALVVLLPLKQIELYEVKKAEGGRLVVDPTPIGRWAPENDSLAYFINAWANSVFDVNRATIEKMVADSMAMTVGSATDELRALRMADNPLAHLAKVPNYSRSYTFRSINFVKKDVALLRFSTTTRENDAVREDTWLMTIAFVLKKPARIEQVIANPAGLFITHFTLARESGLS